MSIINFDPKQVIVLDGYYWVGKFFPNTDLTDKHECETRLKEIFSLGELLPIYENKNPFFFKLNEEVTSLRKQDYKTQYPFLANIISDPKGRILTGSPIMMLPSGGILEVGYNLRLFTGWFIIEGKKYASMQDGSAVSLTPVLDERFLKYHLPLNEVNVSGKNAMVGSDAEGEDLEYLKV